MRRQAKVCRLIKCVKILDVFAGIGGFSLAAHWLGWQTVAFVEKDEFCQKVLRKNFGDIPIYDDIRTFSGKPFRGRVDIITGGFPCQPFSVAGNQKGSSDERHLFPEMLRVIGEVEPSWVVAENVRGLLGIESGETFDEICSSLENLGYAVQTFCIPACAVNAPHRRDRLWIVAHADSARTHSGCGEVQGANGKVSERNDDAESSNSDRFDGNAHGDNARSFREVQKRSAAKSSGINRIDAETSANSDRFGCSDEQKENGLALPNQIGQLPLAEQGRKIKQCGSGESDSVVANTLIQQRAKTRLQVGKGKAAEKRSDANGSRKPVDSNSDNPATARQRRDGGQILRVPESEGLDGYNPPNGWSESWLEAAARLCSVDDGLSGALVRPKGWRVNALKAAGNTILPQIAYVIFKAIKQVERNERL